MRKRPQLIAFIALLAMLVGCMRQPFIPETSQAPVPVPSSEIPSKIPVETQEVPAPEEMLPQYAVAAKEYLSLRSAPDVKAERMKKLLPGSLVTILEEQGEFAHVRTEPGGETGYALRSYLVPADPYALPSPTKGAYRVIAEEYLTLRKQESTKAESLARLDPGQALQLLSLNGDFAKVRTADGLEGYVLAAYIEQLPVANAEAPVEPITVSGEVFIVAAEKYLSLRKEADTKAERIQKLDRGARVLLLSENGAFSFVQDESTGERGYVLKEYLMTEAAFLTLPKETQIPEIRYVDAVSYTHLTLPTTPYV